MPITKNSARQEVILAFVDISLADLVSNVAAQAIELPPNAVVLSGQAITTEAWNSTSTDILDVGDVTSANRYLNDGNIRANGARVPLVPTGFVTTATERWITVTWVSGGGTPTTGKVRLEVQYYVRGRAAFAQG